MSPIWLKDLPAEIRLIVYRTFFKSMTVYVQSHPHKPPRAKPKSEARKINQEENQVAPKRPLNQATSLLLTCKAVKKEAEPVFFTAADFVSVSHRFDLPLETCRWGTIDAATIMRIQHWSAPILMEDPFAYEVLSFRFAQFESMFNDNNSQPDAAETLSYKLKKFSVSNTLGDINDESGGDEDLYYICNLLELARGRVEQVTFKWQQDWDVQLDEDDWDVRSAVFQVRVDSEGNFTFDGHDVNGFEPIKARFIEERPELFKTITFKHIDTESDAAEKV